MERSRVGAVRDQLAHVSVVPPAYREIHLALELGTCEGCWEDSGDVELPSQRVFRVEAEWLWNDVTYSGGLQLQSVNAAKEDLTSTANGHHRYVHEVTLKVDPLVIPPEAIAARTLTIKMTSAAVAHYPYNATTTFELPVVPPPTEAPTEPPTGPPTPKSSGGSWVIYVIIVLVAGLSVVALRYKRKMDLIREEQVDTVELRNAS
mmetsp:Transcript_64614/g.143692  ORF Transcript_64614/g.143692 Transcript_64614/m.143692 type:complete len:205 (+) Transcript_64614:151-765(+)